MQNKLENLITQFDALSLRLRIMLALCAVVVLFMLFDVFWLASNNKQIESNIKNIESTKKMSAEMLTMQDEFNRSLFDKRSDPKVTQLNEINKQLAQKRKDLIEKTINLIQTEDMANMLQRIIVSTKSLRIISLQKEKTEELSKTKDAALTGGDRIRLYRHTLEIVLQGGYASTFSFLENLESMEKKVTFDSLDYIVEKYPNANIKLVISTLSLNEEWIGG